MKFKYDYKNLINNITPIDFYRAEELNVRKEDGAWVVGGLCQFHNDKKPGSFYINLESGSFKCFSCGKGGSNIIAFFMQKYGLSFKDAVQRIYKKYGVTI